MGGGSCWQVGASAGRGSRAGPAVDGANQAAHRLAAFSPLKHRFSALAASLQTPQYLANGLSRWQAFKARICCDSRGERRAGRRGDGAGVSGGGGDQAKTPPKRLLAPVRARRAPHLATAGRRQPEAPGALPLTHLFASGVLVHFQRRMHVRAPAPRCWLKGSPGQALRVWVLPRPAWPGCRTAWGSLGVQSARCRGN